MISREEFVGTIVGMKGTQVIVQRDDGTEVLCSAIDLHRRLGWWHAPIGLKVKVSGDTTRGKIGPRLWDVLNRQQSPRL